MARVKLMELLGRLEDEIKIAEKRASETHKSATEIARTAYNSPSQSGDRVHAERQAVLNAQLLQKLRDLRSEIEGSVDSPVPKVVQPPCYLKVSFGENVMSGNFYFVKTPVNMGGIKLVSTESALGKSILGGKVGNRFEIKRESKIIRQGEILGIE